MAARVLFGETEAVWDGRRWRSGGAGGVGALLTAVGRGSPTRNYTPNRGNTQAAWLRDRLGVEILEIDSPDGDKIPGTIY